MVGRHGPVSSSRPVPSGRRPRSPRLFGCTVSCRTTRVVGTVGDPGVGVGSPTQVGPVCKDRGHRESVRVELRYPSRLRTFSGVPPVDTGDLVTVRTLCVIIITGIGRHHQDRQMCTLRTQESRTDTLSIIRVRVNCLPL